MARNSDGLRVRHWAINSGALKQTAEAAGLTRADGWTAAFSVDQFPQLETFNGLLNEIAALLVDIAQHGLLEWDSGQQPGYAHPCRVLGSDGNVYRSVQAGGEVRNPVVDQHDEFWALEFVGPPNSDTETRGIIRTATPAEGDAGTNDQAAMTPALVERRLAVSVAELDNATGSVAWALRRNTVARLRLNGNKSMQAPTNPVEGEVYPLELIQDATGNRTIIWNAAYRFGQAGAPVLSTGANRTDVLTFQYLSGQMRLMSNIKGF